MKTLPSTFMMAILTFIMSVSVFAETTVTPEFSRHEIEAKWQGRIQLFLDRDQIPLIDLLSFLDRKNGEQVLSWTENVMDKHGVALISFAGYWAPGGGKTIGTVGVIIFMSFPQLLVKVRRHRSCQINYFDEDWQEQTITVNSDLSELLQHEIDHLNGILATMRAIDGTFFALQSQRHLLG